MSVSTQKNKGIGNDQQIELNECKDFLLPSRKRTSSLQRFLSLKLMKDLLDIIRQRPMWEKKTAESNDFWGQMDEEFPEFAEETNVVQNDGATKHLKPCMKPTPSEPVN